MPLWLKETFRNFGLVLLFIVATVDNGKGSKEELNRKVKGEIQAPRNLLIVFPTSFLTPSRVRHQSLVPQIAGGETTVVKTVAIIMKSY